jgi:nitroreductase
METMEAILSRRSIRKYTTKPVPDNLIQKLLEAAMSAPSAGNEQPWHFIVIKDRKILDEIPKIHPYAEMAKEASVAIVVCGDLTLETHKGYWIIDCSAAAENILIAAHANGLGAVWAGLYPREDRVKGIRKLLGIPEHVIPMALIPIGYPAEKKQKENRFNNSRVHYDHW